MQELLTGHWWQEMVPEGNCLKLHNNIYETRQVVRVWHVRLSTWTEEHGYLQVNNKETVFMKWEGNDFILHECFVDAFAIILTSGKFKESYVSAYTHPTQYTCFHDDFDKLA